jgi:predicted transcriptional regulator of viral defense system
VSTAAEQPFPPQSRRPTVSGVDTEPVAEPPALVLRRAALDQGIVDDEIARLRRAGTWTSLQRGAYLVGDPPLDRRTRHELAVRATFAALRTAAVVSHASAAALHGLPLWGIPLQRVHITRRPPARSDADTRLRSHVARLAADDVVVLGSLPVTSLARTVVDLARSLPFAAGLAVADAALHSRKVTPDDLRAVLEAGAGTRGTRAARRVVAAADRRSESVGESRSRAVMIQLGLVLPDLQVEVREPGGRLVGRCDFGWRDARVLGEFDGQVKYGRLLRPGQEPGDAVFEEKRREDALRDERWGMVRWVWRELDTPVLLGRRITRRLRAGR